MRCWGAIGDFILDKTFSPKPLPGKPAKKISQSTGVSVWFPQWIQSADAASIEKNLGEKYLKRGYGNTSFAVETGWDEFLSHLRERAWGLAETNSTTNGLTAMQRTAQD